MATMTRKQFIAKAVKEREERLRIPRGWWGTWDDVHGPGGIRVKRVSPRAGGWTVRIGRLLLSKHDSRSYAIKKAKGLGSTLGT